MKVKQNKLLSISILVGILFISSALFACTGGSGINNNNHNINMQQKVTSSGAWHIVGDQAVSPGEADYERVSTTNDGTLYLAFKDKYHEGKASVMTYNRNINQWQYVGQPGFSNISAKTKSLVIAPDGTIYIVLEESMQDVGKTSVMTYNKNTNQWQYIGQPGFSDGGVAYASLAIAPDGTIYITFSDYSRDFKISVDLQ